MSHNRYFPQNPCHHRAELSCLQAGDPFKCQFTMVVMILLWEIPTEALLEATYILELKFSTKRGS